ncbi:hypothetical protein Dimus_002002 [Dionaea muscipula]
MDDVCCNQTLDVPDTPDRTPVWSVNASHSPNATSSATIASFSGNSHLGFVRHHLAGSNELVPECLLKESSCKNLGYVEQFQPQDSVVLHEHPSAVDADRSFRCESSFARIRHLDGERITREVCSKPSNYQETGACITRPNICPKFLTNPSSPNFVGQSMVPNSRRASSFASGLNSRGGSSKILDDANKGKGKMKNDISVGVGSSIEHRKGSGVSRDPLHRVAKGVSLSENSVPSVSRVGGGKRLVRNGCISPYNISRSKVLAENSTGGSKDVQQLGCDNVSSVGPCHVIDVDEVIRPENISNHNKRKGTITHYSSLRQPNGETVDLSDSGYQCSDQLQRRNGCIRRKCDMSTPNVFVSRTSAPSVASTSSSFVPPTERLNRVCHMGDKNCKGQKESTAPGREIDAELVCLGSREESSRSHSRTDCNDYCQNAVPAHVNIDAHSHEVRSRNYSHVDELDARARQVEADEFLARELQEQLYHEMPEVGRFERGSIVAQLRSQFQSRPFGNRSRRQRASPRFSNSRLATLRNRLYNHSTPPFSRRTMSAHSDMDVDARIDLLEELEAVFNDDVAMVTQLLESDREFNESDYEMLIALDDNNHENLGASFNQIINLPQSTVKVPLKTVKLVPFVSKYQQLGTLFATFLAYTSFIRIALILGSEEKDVAQFASQMYLRCSSMIQLRFQQGSMYINGCLC